MYVEQLEGFMKKGNEDKVYWLNKVLDRLKQAPRAWLSHIESYFRKERFKKSFYDHTLFTKRVGKNFVTVSLYVDDLVFAGNNNQMCEEFKHLMRK